MKKICLIFLLFGTIVHLYSQKDFKPGYIITNEGDTVFGQIDYRGDLYNAFVCMFKGQNASEAIKYEPGQIKSYRFIDGKYYISRKVTIENKDREVFLEFLVDGRADLYYLPQSYYFIERPDKEMQILKNTEKIVQPKVSHYSVKKKEYIGVLNVYLDDCPELKDKISKSTLEQKSLVNIATEYHNRICPDENCIVYDKKNNTFYIYAGLAAGMNYNWLEISTSVRALNNKSSALVYGAQFDIGQVSSRERFFNSVGVYYSVVNHEFKLNDVQIIKAETKNIFNELPRGRAPKYQKRVSC